MVSRASIKRVERILQQAEESLKEKSLKVRRLITIDKTLDDEIRSRKLNASLLCNGFLKYMIRKQDERGNNKAEEGNG